jgi:hypothetical protein
MTLAFVDRIPTKAEFEKFRLILSTYQDGSGMLAIENGRTLPGWRDFERTVATTFNGQNQENKFIFDVLLNDPTRPIQYGISCKMRSELNRIKKDGRVTIELSNSVKKFADFLEIKGIKKSEYVNRPREVGKGIVELVGKWKNDVSIEQGGKIDVSKSCYLTLMYNDLGFYQLHWFKVDLPNPDELNWYYPEVVRNGQRVIAGHINGDDKNGGRVFEWYSDSGGQMKYYPLASSAVWSSPLFKLEPIPENASKIELSTKAKMYFPEQWQKLSGES